MNENDSRDIDTFDTRGSIDILYMNRNDIHVYVTLALTMLKYLRPTCDLSIFKFEHNYSSLL
jgi:hypothetical protein